MLSSATDPPSHTLRDQKLDSKSSRLITLTMWKMIIGQAIFQLAATFTLYFTDLGILRYNPVFDLEDRDSLVFNTYVWMQIFNLLNSRRLDNKLNIFEGILQNYYFFLLSAIIVGVQVLLIFFGSKAVGLVHLTPTQWGCSTILGAISLPVGLLLRLLPDRLIRHCIPERLRIKKSKDIMISDMEEWDNAMFYDKRGFMRKVHGRGIRRFASDLYYDGLEIGGKTIITRKRSRRPMNRSFAGESTALIFAIIALHMCLRMVRDMGHDMDLGTAHGVVEMDTLDEDPKRSRRSADDRLRAQVQ